MLTPECLRAGRAILKWTMRDLERESGVGLTTIYAIENGRRSSTSAGTEAKVIAAFTAHGVELLGPERPGARLTGSKA